MEGRLLTATQELKNLPDADLAKIEKAVLSEHGEVLQQDQEIQKKAFADLLVKYIRVALQHLILKTLNDQAPLASLRLDEFFAFVFRLADSKVIDINSSYTVLEDLFESQPVREIEQVFGILENQIRTHRASDLNQQTKMTLLRIVNGILKKLSVTDDTKFRGRIQMLMACVLPISDKSGVNLNGVYNTNRATLIEELDSVQALPESANYDFYSRLWTLQRFIKNPLDIFSPDAGGLGEAEESKKKVEEEKKTAVAASSLGKFLQTVGVVLDAFESEPPKFTPSAEPYISYPKYLPKYGLLPLQMKDPKFCISYLLQLLFVLESLFKPVSMAQKKYFVLADTEKRLIEQCIERIYKVFARIRASDKEAFQANVRHILTRENAIWTTWKESKSCSPFEQPPNEETLKKFDEACQKVTKHMAKGQPQKLDLTLRRMSKSKTDQMSLFGTTSTSDFAEMLATPYASGIPETLQIPSMGQLLDRVFTDLDPSQGIEQEFHAINDHAFVWKLLRKIAYTDLKIFAERYDGNVEGIAQDLSRVYGRKRLAPEPEATTAPPKEQPQPAPAKEPQQQPPPASSVKEAVTKEGRENKDVKGNEKEKEKEKEGRKQGMKRRSPEKKLK